MVWLQDNAGPGLHPARSQDREAPQEVKSPPEPDAARPRLWAGTGAQQGLLSGDMVGTWHQDRDQPTHLSNGNQLLIWNLQRWELILEPAVVSAVGGVPEGNLHPFPRARGLSPCTTAWDQLSSHSARPCPAPLCPACPRPASPQLEHGPPRGALRLDLGPTPAPLSPCRVPAPWEGLWGCACSHGSCSAEPLALLHLCLQQLGVVGSALQCRWLQALLRQLFLFSPGWGQVPVSPGHRAACPSLWVGGR